MDIATIASISSAVTHLALKVTEGIASEVGKDSWRRIKALLGLTEEPKIEEVPVLTARALEANPAMATKLTELLQQSGNMTVIQLVGSIQAEKVVVAQQIGSLTM